MMPIAKFFQRTGYRSVSDAGLFDSTDTLISPQIGFAVQQVIYVALYQDFPEPSHIEESLFMPGVIKVKTLGWRV